MESSINVTIIESEHWLALSCFAFLLQVIHSVPKIRLDSWGTYVVSLEGSVVHMVPRGHVFGLIIFREFADILSLKEVGH